MSLMHRLDRQNEHNLQLLALSSGGNHLGGGLKKDYSQQIVYFALDKDPNPN